MELTEREDVYQEGSRNSSLGELVHGFSGQINEIVVLEWFRVIPVRNSKNNRASLPINIKDMLVTYCNVDLPLGSFK